MSFHFTFFIQFALLVFLKLFKCDFSLFSSLFALMVHVLTEISVFLYRLPWKPNISYFFQISFLFSFFIFAESFLSNHIKLCKTRSEVKWSEVEGLPDVVFFLLGLERAIWLRNFTERGNILYYLAWNFIYYEHYFNFISTPSTADIVYSIYFTGT